MSGEEEERRQGRKERKRGGWAADGADALGCCLFDAGAGSIVLVAILLVPALLFG